MAHSCALPPTRLLAGDNGRSLVFVRLPCKPPLSRCVHLGSKTLKSRLPGKMASFGSRWQHFCRMSSSDLTSQLEFGKKNNDKRVNGIFWILLLNLGVCEKSKHCIYIMPGLPGSSLSLLHFAMLVGTTFLATLFSSIYLESLLRRKKEVSVCDWYWGANLVSWLVLPRNAVSVGASGAVFGLFAISVLVKIRWNWRKILEVLILGQFVIQRVMEAAQASAALSGTSFALQNVNHIAHLSGALIGVSLIWLLPSLDQEASSSIKKNER